MKVQLSVSASDLKNVAGAFKGKSDPFAVITQVAGSVGASAAVLGKTEVIKNTLSPNWIKTFVFDYELGQPVRIIVSVVDEVNKGENKPMGSALFEVGAVLGARGSTQAKRLKNDGGTIYCSVRRAATTTAGVLRMQLKGLKLKNVEGWIGKSDPFYEVSRMVNAAGGDTWDNVYRSQKVKDNLNPEWDPAAIDMGALCDSGDDLDCPVLIRVFDFESKGDHVAMGQFETTVNGLIEAADSGDSFTLMQEGKEVGHIMVLSAEVSKTTATGQEEGEGEGEEAVPEEERLAAAAALASSSGKRYSFVDYVNGGCQLNVVVAIDFTGSNGNPMEAGTLHYLGDGKNDYEKAIVAICGILAKYDHDQRFPVFGFGAKYDGEVRHCFTCRGSDDDAEGSDEVQGVDGILRAYRNVFRSGLIMSGPTVFMEVMETAAARATSRQEAAMAKGEQAYTILLILTDGAVSDAEATAACLRQVRDAPLSIVIVGVGTADFSAMEFLDTVAEDTSEEEDGGGRDIAQFVQFNQHAESSTDLSSVTLREIPDQLVGYFRGKGIDPLPTVRLEQDEIVPQEQDDEEEIDLTLDFQGDDEIVVSGGGGADLVQDVWA